MLGDPPGEERTVRAASDVMPRRYREKGARIVVETHGVVESGRLGDLLTVSAHAFGAIEEPPGRANLERRVVARKRRELARVGRLVESEDDEREARVVAKA